MPRKRVAAIDVGTNSIHLIVAEEQRHGFRIIDKEKEMVQLGRASLEGRPLTDEAMARGIEALRRMAGIAERWKVQEVVAVATSAIREAPNGRKFLTAAQKASGIKVRVISGDEEADYIYRAVKASVDFQGGTVLVIDIGGGSVEFIVGTADEVYLTASEPLGSLRIAQKFELEDAATDAAVERCRRHVRKRLARVAGDVKALGFDFGVGTSGTIMTLAEMADEASDGSSSSLRWLARTGLTELIGILAPMDTGARAGRFSLDERRAATILGGAIVLDEIMRKLKLDQIRASDTALREGMVGYVLQREARPQGSVRRSSVLALVERSDVEQAHTAHVAKLALRIFDQTEPLHRLPTGERELLEYAALLHEVGMHVSYQGYQKHSYYLISHAGLRGFTPDQVAVVANVARYHRKSPPAEDDENFAPLSPRQKDVVRKLTAILRVADALDRGRRRAVRDVGLDLDGGEIRFEVRTRGDAMVELESAAKRGTYFGKVFERRVTIGSSRG